MTIKSDFFAKSKRETKTVQFFGMDLTLRKLTRSELTKIEKWMRPKGVLDEQRFDQHELKLIQQSVVDADGKLVFDDEDLDKLGEMPGAEMSELEYEVMVLNGMIKPKEAKADVLGESNV